MGDGNRFFPLVRRNGGYRRTARVLGLACRTLDPRNWRIGRVSVLCEDPGAACSRGRPRVCKRANRGRSWLWSSSGHVFWRHAHGAIWMAPFFHLPWSRQHGLADSLVLVDTTSRDRNFARGEG